MIAGGGVGGLEAALALRALAHDRVDVTLVADASYFVYRPLAVGVPFGGAATVRVELAAVAEDRGFTLVPDRVRGVELDRRRLITEDAGPLGYDHLVLALGAVQEPAVSGALTFRGPADVERFRSALGALADRGDGGRVAFVVRSGTEWTLPLYELALLTASWAAERELDLRVELVTPERAPLEVFGPEVSAEVRQLLDGHRIEVHDGLERRVEADLVVALPLLRGRAVDGLAQDDLGFVPVDAFCRVEGVTTAYAIGDMTAHRLKQGGLTAQQADVAAASIAAAAGAPVRPEPYKPVLRALLLTGGRPRYLRHPPAEGHEGPAGDVSALPWWPPHKIVGAHLAPYLATHAELLEPLEAPGAPRPVVM
jgi:sulfide:quinone oxidoreductase